MRLAAVATCVSFIAIGATSAAPTAAALPASRAPMLIDSSEPTHVADGWHYIRLSCRTITAGQVCVGFLGNGRPSTYRVQYVLRPRPGQWIRPDTEATFRPLPETRTINDFLNHGSFCATTCPVERRPRTIVRPTTLYGVHEFGFSTAQGSGTISAGVTTTLTHVDSTTKVRLAVYTYLSTTADGRVWQSRRVGVNAEHPTVVKMIEHQTFYTHTFAETSRRSTVFSSREYYHPATTSSVTSIGPLYEPLGRVVGQPYAFAFYRDGAARTWLLPLLIS